MNTIQYFVFIKSLVFRNFLWTNTIWYLLFRNFSIAKIFGLWSLENFQERRSSVFGIRKFFKNEDLRSSVFGQNHSSVQLWCAQVHDIYQTNPAVFNQNLTQQLMFQYYQPMRNHDTGQLQEGNRKINSEKVSGQSSPIHLVQLCIHYTICTSMVWWRSCSPADTWRSRHGCPDLQLSDPIGRQVLWWLGDYLHAHFTTLLVHSIEILGV